MNSQKGRKWNVKTGCSGRRTITPLTEIVKKLGKPARPKGTRMARYGQEADIKTALKVPEGAKSWEDGDFDGFLTLAAEEADKRIDEMCIGWSPYDTSIVKEDRTFTANYGQSIEGILDTDPYTVPPSIIEVNGSRVPIKFTPLHRVQGSVSGKSLMVADGSQYGFTEGVPYTCKGASWNWAGIPAGVKLAWIRIAARSFTALRRSMGVIDVGGGGVIYEPKYDPQVKQWLGKFLDSGAI